MRRLIVTTRKISNRRELVFKYSYRFDIRHVPWQLSFGDVCKTPERLENFNLLRPRQNRRHFADEIFKCIFLNENVWISINISLKFVLKGLINNIAALVQIMAWRRPGDKPLFEPMMVNLLTHICVTRPQWVKHRYRVFESSRCDETPHAKLNRYPDFHTIWVNPYEPCCPRPIFTSPFTQLL